MDRFRSNDVTYEDVTYLEHYFIDYCKSIYSDDVYINLINAFQSLPLEERRLFIIFMLCDNNSVNVSNQLGISVWVVRARIRDIKKTLKKYLENSKC